MTEQTYDLIINHGIEEGFEKKTFTRKDFIDEISNLLKPPKKIFLGLGDFLEVGDYNKLMDSALFSEDSMKLESVLDKNNRRIAEEGEIPFSFFKLAVYFPDFLLKDIPTYCVSMIGQKARLFPGASNLVKHLSEYDPVILTALPYEIAIEISERSGMKKDNLISTEYKIHQNENNKRVYAGDIQKFISGDRKRIEIWKIMTRLGLKDDEIFYLGRGEAGVKTFSAINSIAFNPSQNIIPASNVTLYGSSLESLLVLFNFNGRLNKILQSNVAEEYIPSLVVYSEKKEKSEELVDIELEHLRYQNNIIGQRIENSGESYKSVERELEVAFTSTTIDIKEVKEIIHRRLKNYVNSPDEFVKKIYQIAKARYKTFYSDKGDKKSSEKNNNGN